MYTLITYTTLHPEEKNTINERIISQVAQTGRPVVCVHGWKPGCVNVGAGQDIAQAVDVQEAQRQGLVVVQRAGGGGTMYLSEDGEVSWMLAYPTRTQDINEDYADVCGRVVDALATLGIEAQHKPINDVVTANGKISGATARRTQGVTYVGGTLLYSVDREKLWAALYPHGVDSKGRAVSTRALTSVQEECGASKQELICALQHALTQGRFEVADALA